MTLTEAKDILVNRLGFRDDETVTGFVLSASNLQSDSGRFFQSEHSAVTLQNIRDCQPKAQITTEKFNAYLGQLKEQAVIQVLSEVFERDQMDGSLLTKYPRAFDNAISLRMVIIISEIILTSSRSNKIARFTDAFVGKLNYDIFRDSVQKFAASNVGYNVAMGASTRFLFEINSLRRRFGNQRNMLKTITKSEVFTTQIPESDEYFTIPNPFQN